MTAIMKFNSNRCLIYLSLEALVVSSISVFLSPLGYAAASFELILQEQLELLISTFISPPTSLN